MIKKIKYIILFSILILLGLCTKSQARITTTDPTVDSGENVTITINSQEPVANGSISVSSPGGLTFVSASASGGVANGTLVAFAGTDNKTSGIATYTFKAPSVTKTTKYEVEFKSQDMEDAEGNTVPASTATATVTVRAPSSSGSSGSSSSGSSSGGSNQTSTPSFSSVNQTVYAISSVNVRSSYTTSSSIIGSLDAGDSVTRTGVGSNGWSRVTYNGRTAYVNSSYLTTTAPEEEEEEPEESNNKDLESLIVEGYMLTPEFSNDVTDYSLTINDDVDSLEITAEPVDENAEVEIIGNSNLLIGDNTIQVKVTAEDGTIRTYRINVTKGSQTEIGLTSLIIEGYALTPEFDGNIYEYTLEINDPSVTSLNINTETSDENATVEITGNTNLQLGRNIITILVKSEDETENATYQVIVNINEIVETQIIPGIDDEDLFMYAGIGIGVLVVLIIIVILVVRHRRKNNDDNPYDNYYNAFDSLDEDDNKKNDKEENKKELKDDSLSNIKDKNINTSVDYSKEETKKEEPKSEEKPKRKERDSIIDKNFGDNVEYEDSDDKQKRKKGKHF